jgi:hypothetical protein
MRLGTGRTLPERLRDAREKHYKEVADIIASNPDKSYGVLMVENGFTSWAIKKAVKIGGISRPCGRRSPAYKNRMLGGRTLETATRVLPVAGTGLLGTQPDACRTEGEAVKK